MQADPEFERHIQRCCTIVDTPSESGTGFFITPRVLVTCAHVTTPAETAISYNGTPHAVETIDVIDGLDVAILTLSRPVPDVACVRLTSDVQVNDTCYTFGYPLFEGQPRADARVLEVEGLVDSRHEIVLKGGQIAAGQSGSPLVNLRTGAVCGIIRWTRDSTSAAGGRATTVAEILRRRPFLLEKNLRVHEDDHSWDVHLRRNVTVWQPPMPRRYVKRPAAMERLLNRLFSTDESARDVVAVVAPSGFGKSTLAADLYRRYAGPKRWVDFRQPGSASATSRHELIVLDELDRVIPSDGDIGAFMRENLWLEELQGRVLILTARATTAKALLVRLGGPGAEHNVVELSTGFTSDEASAFVETSIIEDARAVLTPEQRMALNSCVLGSPFIWQMTADLANSSQLPELFAVACDTGSRDTLQSRVLSLWLDTVAEHSDLTRRVVSTLCSLSTIGMSGEALAAVMERPLTEINDAVAPLVSRGFVWPALPADRTLIPHALLRACCQGTRPDVGDATRYRQFFARALSAKGPRTDYLTLIDAWVGGMRDTFLQEDTVGGTEPFVRRYGAAAEQLQQVIPASSGITLHAKWLAAHFRETVTKECSIVVPLAKIFFHVPPQQTFAEILWHGSNHDDGLAQAFCVKGAAIHWSGQGPQIARRGADRLLGFCGLQTNYVGLEFPAAAALAGAVRLGYSERVLEKLRALAWRAPLAVIAVVLALIEENRRNEAGEVAKEFWGGLPAGQDRYLAEPFLLEHGITLEPLRIPSLTFNIARGKMLGEIAFCPSYAEYVALVGLRSVPATEDRSLQMTFSGVWPDTYFSSADI
ncbi:MAG TPA: trypsin-like peptidase domain-containing protein [Thermoanaerobaculia bacterium]|jgi:hypothetical protein